MFLATCPISKQYWKESRLNCQFSQPVPVSDSIFSTSPYLTDTSVLNHIISPALDCSQVFLVLGSPEKGTALQMFPEMLSRSLPSICWQLPSSSSPRHCCFLCFGYVSKTILMSHRCFCVEQYLYSNQVFPFSHTSQRIGQVWTKHSEGTPPEELI